MQFITSCVYVFIIINNYFLFSATRLMRNIAEKQRRDKMNKFIMELACLVPMVAGSSKKMDKTSILRLSANFLRMYRCLRELQCFVINLSWVSDTKMSTFTVYFYRYNSVSIQQYTLNHHCKLQHR